MNTIQFKAKELSTARDIQSLFHNLRKRVSDDARIIVTIYNYLWKPFRWQSDTNWLTISDISNLLELEGFQVIKADGNFFRFEHSVIARPRPLQRHEASVSIVIPVRNEEGNLQELMQRLPKFAPSQEIIFVEGNSKDNSWQELQRLKKLYPDIRIMKQRGIGKADAMRLGFTYAHGDILIILDADLSVAPEELPKFYEAIVSGNGEFINGSRLVYPVEKEAMRYVNILGNQFFSTTLSWIIGQHIKDTLCGTKAISREQYRRIVRNRKYFGDFDPFGDFDLIFGAAKLNLKFIEIPVRYHARVYGKTNISRFRHGLLLLKMTLFALFKMKFV